PSAVAGATWAVRSGSISTASSCISDSICSAAILPKACACRGVGDVTKTSMSTFCDLARLLSMNRLTHVVDIGANPIEGAPSYSLLLDAQLCRVRAFDPQASALAELNQKKGATETSLPFAGGEGREHPLNLCAYSGWTSIFVPSTAALEAFSFFK